MRPVRLPYAHYQGRKVPIVPIGIKGPHGWKRVWVYVDSGASTSIFTTVEAKRLGVDYRQGKQTFVTVGDGGLIPVFQRRLAMQIGAERFLARIGFSPRLGVGFNLLGREDIFTRFDVTFSDARGLLIFSKPVQ